MNALTVAGVALVAVGTFVMLLGQGQESGKDRRAVEAKIDSVRHALADARTRPAPEREAALDSIDAGFNAWAEDLVRNRERKQLDLRERDLAQVKLQMDTSRKTRPVWDEVLGTIRKSCEAYAAKSGSAINISLPGLPENLFEAGGNSAYTGKVVFGPHCAWAIGTLTRDPGQEARAPSMIITVYDPAVSNSELLGNYVAVRVNLEAKSVDFDFYGESFPRPKEVLEDVSFKESLEPVSRATQELVETQLLSLR